jgi:hypothetical protein
MENRLPRLTLKAGYKAGYKAGCLVTNQLQSSDDGHKTESLHIDEAPSPVLARQKPNAQGRRTP